MPCRHCQKPSGGNFTAHGLHEESCDVHLFCDSFCEKGRQRLIDDVTLAVVKAMKKIRAVR